ncbi:MAG: sugar transferase [Solirubrobacteraceae bacterium]|nr:sugar transferase [Solirubrobacteraceae bacterium]
MGQLRRFVDLVLVLLLLPLLAPFALLVAICVFLDSPGPILYRAQRVGTGGRTFDMLKFRTMRHGAAGPAVSRADDPRYTPFGRFLARTRLDELPQVVNVVRGEMRLVGPRPEDPAFVARYADDYRTILSVPPGVTGPAAVEFAWEGEVLALAEEAERESVYQRDILPLKVAIDVRYALERTWSGDLWILLRTLSVPLRQCWLPLMRRGGGARPRRLVVSTGLTVGCVAVFAVSLTLDGLATL